MQFRNKSGATEYAEIKCTHTHTFQDIVVLLYWRTDTDLLIMPTLKKIKSMFRSNKTLL